MTLKGNDVIVINANILQIVTFDSIELFNFS